MAVQQIKQRRLPCRRAAARQASAAENQLGPLRDYVVAWLKAGQKDFAAARAALAQAEAGRRRAAEAPVTRDRRADRRDGGRQGGGRGQVPPRRQLDPSALRVVLSSADGLRRLGKDADARAILKTFGDKYGDTVVMDGLLAANAPMPKPPTAASGIGEIMFDIGSTLNADPRNARGDLALIFEQPRRRPEARPRFRLADDRRPLRAVGPIPQGDGRLCQGRGDLAALRGRRACAWPRSMRRRTASTRR